jgi:hypothetical protein
MCSISKNLKSQRNEPRLCYFVTPAGSLSLSLFLSLSLSQSSPCRALPFLSFALTDIPIASHSPLRQDVSLSIHRRNDRGPCIERYIHAAGS